MMTGERDGSVPPAPRTPGKTKADQKAGARRKWGLIDPALQRWTRRRMQRDQRAAARAAAAPTPTHQSSPARPAVLPQMHALEPRLLMAGDVVYALNAGGGAFTDANGVAWVSDLNFVNQGAAESQAYSTNQSIDLTDPSVPTNTQQRIFKTERWDPPSGAEMSYSLGVDAAPAEYQVDLYFADIFSGTQSVNARVFDVLLEGQKVLDDYDQFADVGGYTGVVKTFTVAVNDGTLNIDFTHEIENPALKAVLVRTVEVDPPDPVAPAIDLNGNAAGTGSTTTFVVGEGPTVVPEADAVLTDADSATLSSLTASLASTPDGTSEILDADVSGTAITKSYANGVLTLSGVASVADYQAVLRTISYDNLVATPNLSARSVDFIANDGGLNSNLASVTVQIDPNEPDPVAPVIDLNGSDAGSGSAAAFVAGGGPVVVPEADAVLSDVDSATLSSLTISLTSTPDGANEFLDANVVGTNIVKSYADGVLTLSGFVPITDYQAVLRTVTYNNTAAAPDAATRSINFVANDGALNSNTAIASVTVDPNTPDPVAPVIDLNGDAPGTGNAAAFIGGGGPVAVPTPNAVLTDADSFALSSLTVTLTNTPDGTNEILDADVLGTGIAKSYANGVLTLSGATPVADYQAVLLTITYNNTAAAPDAATRSINFVANDGALNSNTAIASVTVDPNTPDPVAPVIDLNGNAPGTGNAANFVEGEGAVAVPGADAVLSDVDSATLSSLTVSLASTPDGANEILDANVTGTGIGKSYANGVLTLSGAAPVADYQAVLRTVTYNNTAATPSTATRSIAFVANDGALDSNAANASVTVEIDEPLPGQVVYALNAGGSGFTDTNGVTWVNDAPFTNVVAADSRNFSTNSSINLTNPSVPAGSDQRLFKTERWDPGAGAEMSYSLDLDPAEYQIDLYFADIFSGTQSVGARVFDIVIEGQTVIDDYDVFADAGGFAGVVKTFNLDVNDGTLNLELLHETENPAIKAILVRTVGNDPTPIAPLLDLDAIAPGSGNAAAFTPGDGPIALTAADALLTDADSATLDSLTVALSATPDGASERLDADVTGTGLSKTFAGGILSLAGPATVAEYQAVLRTVTYDNLAATPDGATRTVSFIANDGTLDSNVAVATVNVQTGEPQPGTIVADVSTLDFGDAQTGVVNRLTLTLTHPGAAIDDPVTITAANIVGNNAGVFGTLFDQLYPGGVTLQPGDSVELTVYALPNQTGNKSATLRLVHDGQSTPLSISLAADAIDPVALNFGTGLVTGIDAATPTTLQWGPDGRLYVGTLDGLIHAYAITRNGPSNYSVTNSETLTLVQDIPNHEDDGTLNTAVDTRLITGIKVVGTAQNPVIYVTSSDPRLTDGNDSSIDTNSGIVSKLTRSGGAGGTWSKVDLVRGLPRSKVDHAPHALEYLQESNTLLVAVGGLTNSGAPDDFFGDLPEYALSAAILRLDLNTLEGLSTKTDAQGQQYKYNLPTLNDEDRPGTDDAGDPFGGNAGKNQAVLEANGPVDLFASGLRNPYDFIRTQFGHLYSTDNGPNASLGGTPILVGGQPTNQPNPGGETAPDNLHLITEGFYAGHPNPTRANTNNTFNNTNPQSPVYNGYTEPGDYREAGNGDGAIATFDTSTNGITEYTANKFGNALNGDLLTVTIDGKLTRLKLSPDGSTVIDSEVLFNNSGGYPLDVTTVGDDHSFAGTIWVADLFAAPGQGIRVFEPNANNGQSTPDDLDGDGYLNQDEIDNGTDPNSAGDTPPDNDTDFTSDLNDPDDDNDALADLTDPFQVDGLNGNDVAAPYELSFNNDDLNRGGLLDLGFTGLMTNGSTNYLDQFDPANLTAGSAAGVLTIDVVSPGTALGNTNTQENAFQFGLNLNNDPVVIHSKLNSVFDNTPGNTPTAGQRAGIYFGTGDQDNYFSVFVEGDGTINTVTEINGNATLGTADIIGTNNFNNVHLYITVDPAVGTARASYALGDGPVVDLLGDSSFPASWLNAATAPAVGVISTSGNAGSPYSVTYDFIKVDPVAGDNQRAFNGTFNEVGQRVEAEHYDLGGEGVAYFDLTAGNEGGNDARPGDNVDFEDTSDAGGGANIGWINAGEWLEYSFNLEEAGTYSADFRVALESGPGATFHLEADGVNVSGPVTLPNTGGWQNWTTVTVDDLQLDAGPVVLRVAFDANSTASYVGNLNWLQLDLVEGTDGSPPTVAAGPDGALAGPAGTLALDATVTDNSTNGVPLRTVWNLVSGPAAVTFDDPFAVDTNANFTAPGVYVLRLSADNGIGGIVSDDRVVTVNPAAGGLVASVDVLNDGNGNTLGTLNANPLDPGDIAWTTILIDESQVNNFPGSADGSTDSPATGSASFFFDASTNELSYEITYAGLTADLTNIHIHGPADAGESNMAHIFDVFSNEQDVIDSGVNRRSDTVAGLVNLTSHTHGGANPTPTLAEALDALTTGQAYVNVHTTAFPMGEIRGNVPVAIPADDPFFDLGPIDASTLRFAADTTAGVGSVRYVIDGVPLTGDTWEATTGEHTLIVTPFANANQTGTAGPSTTYRFTVRADAGPTRLAEWTPIANAPFAQYEGQGVEANGKLYLFGGFINGSLNVTDRFAAYDPATDTWTNLADAPRQLTHANHVVDGDKIYVLGGYVGTHPGGSTDEVWVYDIATDTWSAGPDLPEDRAGAGAAILGRTLYYYGGATRDQGDVNTTVDHADVWTLDLGATAGTGDDAATWATGRADMPDPRNHMAGVELDGFLYALGGQTGENEFTGNSDRVHRYDPVADTWTRVADLPIEIGHITASTFTANGRIFVVTGVTENSVSTDTIFMYDPDTDTWTALPPAPVAAQSPIALHLDGKVYVIGGDESPGGITSKAYVMDLDESWFALQSAPVALGEVGAGVIGNKLYVVGENNNATLAYDLGTGTWSSTNALAKRAFAGSHHATEVIDGKLYLFGGLGAGSEGKVQIYDPDTDQWSAGADVPLSVGSASSVYIDGKVYLAGGVLGDTSTDAAFVYDVASDTWSTIASLPREINHAGGVTDGTKFYIFTGRDGGNRESNGFNTVQIYDPATNTWESSDDPGSTIAPVPEARGGMGRAVYLDGEFYVIGGETENSPNADANRVYDRVDIYNPATNTWRLGTPMPTARHGIYPIEHAGVIYIAGGGVVAGASASNLLEAYYVDAL